MPTYKIEAEIAVEVNYTADDPDAALEKFFELLDDQAAGSWEANRYRVYEL